MVCSGCQQETNLVTGCVVETIKGHRVFRVQNRNKDDIRCRDCSCLQGKLHHIGCIYEECPLCADMMQTCECGYTKS